MHAGVLRQVFEPQFFPEVLVHRFVGLLEPLRKLPLYSGAMIVLDAAEQGTLGEPEAFDLREAEKAEATRGAEQGKTHFTSIPKKRILVPTGVLEGT
ncbi:MAG TPA: hypothetical protein VN428_17730 [Bryobacteraceae bacterium]|nr:hypothetical protein [Bryobacteraceae bacterium]